jgi:hypothetical protein
MFRRPPVGTSAARRPARRSDADDTLRGLGSDTRGRLTQWAKHSLGKRMLEVDGFHHTFA